MIFAVLACLLITVCYAHSGRTDSKGGHYDRKNGGYHYHHGYPAHDHPDGKCPYDFDDKTADKSSSSSNSKSAESKVPKNKEGRFSNDGALSILMILVGCMIATPCVQVALITIGERSNIASRLSEERTEKYGDWFLYFAIAIRVLNIYRIMMLGVPWWAKVLIALAEYFFGTFFFCLPEFALYIVAFVSTLLSKQDGWAVAYYVIFVLYLIYFILQSVSRIYDHCKYHRKKR